MSFIIVDSFLPSLRNLNMCFKGNLVIQFPFFIQSNMHREREVEEIDRMDPEFFYLTWPTVASCQHFLSVTLHLFKFIMHDTV